MRYIDLLKELRVEKGHASNPTKPTQAPSVSFVSAPCGHFQGAEAEPDALAERAGMLLVNGLPMGHVDGLAHALHLVAGHPAAEAALCWLIDNRYK